MPCTYTGSLEGDARLAAETSGRKLTEVTNMLCLTLREFEKFEEFENLPAHVRKWWREHKKLDTARRERDRQRLRRDRIRLHQKER